MSTYINATTDEYPVSFARVKQAHPTTSFSVPPASIGDFRRVEGAAAPSFDPETQYLTEVAPTVSDGGYFRSWTVHNHSAEELEHKSDKLVTSASNSIRKERNALLAETDWWALQDNTMSDAQATYRQALRDITSHANFPNLDEADWPINP